MKANMRFTKYIFVIILILLATTGIYLANRTYQYDAVVKGILGIAFLYYLFSYLIHSGTDTSLTVLLSNPKPYKHLIFVLIESFLVYWATVSILDMVSLLIGI